MSSRRPFVFSRDELLAYLKELESYGLITINNLAYLKAQLEKDEKVA